jgi:hypothetical protein
MLKSAAIRFPLILAIIVLLLATVGCASETPSPGDTSPAATPPAGTSTPAPPAVTRFAPEQGQEQPLDTPITITFDQPMDRASVEKAFAIEPGAAVDGAFTWPDDQTVQFALKEGFAREQRYRVRIVETAQSQTGLPLAQPFEMRFSTVGALEVVSVLPADGAGDISPQTVVTVLFNRPVVELTAIENLDSLPDPLTFVPAVRGEGEWLNTTTYRFTPDDSLKMATAYTARVAQGLSSPQGALLADDFEWQFTTLSPTPTPEPISPAVIGSIPPHGDGDVLPTTKIIVNFNMPVDREQAQAKFTLRHDVTAQAVPGSFVWRGGAEDLLFTPDAPLAAGTTYRVEVAAGVPTERGPILNDFASNFTVAPAPAVLGLFPGGRENEGPMAPWESVEIRFNTPMDPDSLIVGQTLLITPPVPVEEVHTYWEDNNTKLRVNLPLEFSQPNTLTVGANLTSRAGLPLGVPETVAWKTHAKSPLLFIQSPNTLATYNAYTRTTLLLTVRNIGRVNLELYRLSPAEFMRVEGEDNWQRWEKYQPPAANLLHAWELETALPLNENRLFELDLGPTANLGTALPPGLYYLRATAPSEAAYPEAVWDYYSDESEYQILVVSNYNLTLKESGSDTLLWATDLQSGQPAPDLPTRLMAGRVLLGEATTDEGGVALIDYPDRSESWESFYAWVGDFDAPGEDFALTISDWRDGIERYDFENISTEESQANYIGYFYTHRALYRPGETVHFKGIIRANDDATYSLPQTTAKATVIIRDAQGKELYNEELPLSDMGTVNGTLELAADASLGDYQIEASYAGDTFYEQFQVLAYRLPEFQVSVQTDRARYTDGDTISATVASEFFFGGPVSNAAVRWTLLSGDYYAFRGGELDAYDFVNEELGRDYAENYQGGFDEKIAEGTGETDDTGHFIFEVPADIGDKLSTQLYTLDVVVTDVNNQEVAAQARVLIHKGKFLVGLRPERFVGRTGEPNGINVLAVDWNGQPVAGQEVVVTLSEYQRYSIQRLASEVGDPYSSYYWENIAQTIPVISQTVTTDDKGEAVATFNPPTGGIYNISAGATDSNERLIQASLYTWVSGPDYINWGQEDHHRLKLVADQPEYSVGDTARILIPHPFSTATTALVTLERGHVYEHFVRQLDSNSEQIEIPITEAMLPNIFVSVVVVQGAGDAPDGLPGFELGYVALPINPAEKQLQITMTPNRPPAETYQPGDKVSYAIKVTDVQGQPVKAELSLALVDKAILSLAPEQPGQLLERFWRERGLAVTTATGLTRSIDRFNQAVIKAKGGGGGCLDCGGAEKGFGQTRRNLLDTALWVADFTTDANGEGTVETTLPDNLTTWTLTGVGVTGAETLVGEESQDIISTKPLLVRPVTPRFLVVGDEPQLGLIVQNNTDHRLEAQTLFAAEGLELRQWRLAGGAWRAMDEAQTLTVGPQTRVKLEYKVMVEPVATVPLTLGVRVADGSGSDSLAFALPVYRFSTPETVGTAGQLDTAETRIESLSLPDSFDPTQGALTVKIAGSLAAGMRDGLTYLEHFPYECTEQTVSRFLPNVVTYRAYRDLGLEEDQLPARVLALKEKLPVQVSVGLQRLYKQQHVDGGWGWWINDQSSPTLTAYVLFGLVEAKRAGFAVEQTVLDSAVDFLERSLEEPRSLQWSWSANQQAFALYVLAEAGSGDLGRSIALFGEREKLDLYGLAYLALAIHILDAEAPQIETLVNDLATAAIVSATGTHWEEKNYDYQGMNTNTRTTAIIIAALSRIRPDHPLLPNGVRWLMTIRKHGGHWETTQETAWTIIGLTEWMVATGELEGDYTWRVSLNGDLLGEGRVTPATIDETAELRVEVRDLLAAEANRLAIERDAPGSEITGGPGMLYYTAHLNYYKPANEVVALDRGISVSREYRYPNEPGAISEAKLGDVIEVKLTIVAPNDLHYLIVEDPLPAGTEGILKSLATSSVVDETTADSFDDRGYFSHTEIRDEKAVLFATYLPSGTYTYIYHIRASLPGAYRVIPTHAEEMYFPEVFGRGDGGLFRIVE